MSVTAEDTEHPLTLEELLLMVVEQLKLLNARLEEGFETGIEEGDTDDN